MTHYETLEVSERASLAVVNAAWKVLMQRYHPEGSEPDGEKARLVNSAHDVLENPESRRRYDLNLAQERQAEIREAAAREPQWPIAQGYPSAYPPDILQMAAMRIGASALSNLFAQIPELQFIVNTALKHPRGGRQ